MLLAGKGCVHEGRTISLALCCTGVAAVIFSTFNAIWAMTYELTTKKQNHDDLS